MKLVERKVINMRMNHSKHAVNTIKSAASEDDVKILEDRAIIKGASLEAISRLINQEAVSRPDDPVKEAEVVKRWCVCTEVKYAYLNVRKETLVVGCDNPHTTDELKNIPEWYHAVCVNLANDSDVKNRLWYCPTCAPHFPLAMLRRPPLTRKRCIKEIYSPDNY